MVNRLCCVALRCGCACSQKSVVERLLLKRLVPHVAPLLDESQAGFRWGAEEQIYTLAETLRLRGQRQTFGGFVDVRKAFDVVWRDAVLVKLAEAGVTGRLWSVIADLLTDTTARASVNGSLSEPWSAQAGVRQGSVLGPLLFNLLFDGIAATVRAACPGVALGNEPDAPRVTLLLYADDSIILADNPSDLQNGLTAIGAWGSQWRFSVGVGPDKTAVLVVGSRRLDYRFQLQGSPVPCVKEYCYLGVVFQSSRKWQQHVACRVNRSTRKFHQCLGWAENRGLCTNFRASLFRSYVCLHYCTVPNSLMPCPCACWTGSCDNLGVACSGGLVVRQELL